MEYGDNSKELTEQMEDMMTELATYNIDTKLRQTFLTVMLNVINVLHQKRDAETDEFMAEVETEEEEKEIKKSSYLENSQRKGTLGPRKPKADEILPKKKTDEIVPKTKSVLNYNSSDSEDTMQSKIPMKLEIDHNNIMKLKQRILVWAAQQSGYNTNDIPIKLLLKNLDQIYSGSYRALTTISVEEARQIDLPPWFTTRLKNNTTDMTIQPDNLQLSKGSPSKASPYKIARKKPSVKQNTSELSTSTNVHQISGHTTLTKGLTVKFSDDEGVRDKYYNNQEKYNDSEETNTYPQDRDIMKDFRLNIFKTNEDWSLNQARASTQDVSTMSNNYLSQITMESQKMDTENQEQYSQESIQEQNSVRPRETTKNDIHTDPYKEDIPHREQISNQNENKK